MRGRVWASKFLYVLTCPAVDLFCLDLQDYLLKRAPLLGKERLRCGFHWVVGNLGQFMSVSPLPVKTFKAYRVENNVLELLNNV